MTARMIRLAPICALAVMLAPAARGETLDELYQKAKAEKEVVFYSGGPAAPHENRAKLFMQQYPGIEVKVTGGFSNVLNEQIEKQMAEKKLAVDMAFFQTVQDFVKWKQEGKLLAFKPDGFDQIYPNFRDVDGAYLSFSANALTYAYNKAAVKLEDVPKSALDFLKPMFMGKAISVYPADDDAALYLFHIIVQKYGWNWMDQYTANKANYVQGHLPVARSVASGENLVTFDASSSVWEFRRQGKLEVAFPQDDQDPGVFTLTGGIFEGRAASERGEALRELVPGQGAAGQGGLVLDAQRRGAAGGLQAAHLIQHRQQLSRVHGGREADHRAADADGEVHRPAGEQRRGEVSLPLASTSS